MPQYSIYVLATRGRVKYPRSFDQPNAEAARKIALRIAQVFIKAIPGWEDLPPDEQDAFVLEIVNEKGQVVLTVPFNAASGN